MIFKLDNINNLTSARWAAANGFSHLSFNFEKLSAFYCPPMSVSEIKPWINGLQIGGSFSINEQEYILDIIQLLTLDFIELDMELFSIIFDKVEIPVFLRAGKEEWIDLQKLKKLYPNIKAFLLDPIEILVPENAFNQCIIPSTAPINFKEFIPYGVSFSSEPESESGILNFENLDKEYNRWSPPW